MAIEASKQSAASQVYANLQHIDGLAGNYSSSAQFQHGSSGDTASMKHMRNMLKTSSGTATAHNKSSNHQLIANAKEQLLLQANGFYKNRTSSKLPMGQLEQMALTHGSTFGGSG